MRLGLAVLALSGLFAISACTTEQVERGTIGAALGAVGAELLDQDPVKGAAVGAAVGVVTAE